MRIADWDCGLRIAASADRCSTIRNPQSAIDAQSAIDPQSARRRYAGCPSGVATVDIASRDVTRIPGKASGRRRARSGRDTRTPGRARAARRSAAETRPGRRAGRTRSGRRPTRPAPMPASPRRPADHDQEHAGQLAELGADEPRRGARIPGTRPTPSTAIAICSSRYRKLIDRDPGDEHAAASAAMNVQPMISARPSAAR